MKEYKWIFKGGITRATSFEEKGLAQFAANCGIKCDHSCTYCSSGTMVRMHKVFRRLNLNPFENNYAIIDINTPSRIACDARRKRKRGMVQLCTITDAWSPIAQLHDLGRQCLEAILSEPGWTVRILTKNAAVRKDFDLIEKHKDHILIGLSITATRDRQDVISAVEPNASPIEQRMMALQEAHKRGLRTYGMLCPLLPGIADSPSQINELVKSVVDCGAEEIFSEAVNPRGPGLRHCQEALKLAGYYAEAKAIEKIRKRHNWSKYVVNLLGNVQQSVRKYSEITKLRFLLYPSRLLPEDVQIIRKDDTGVIWLGK